MLLRGGVPEFLRKPIATCDFPGGGGGPPAPLRRLPVIGCLVVMISVAMEEGIVVEVAVGFAGSLVVVCFVVVVVLELVVVLVVVSVVEVSE